MNLQYLKAFYVTVKVNSMSKAAEMLHMTQPGVSIQIQSLEKELNVSLLNRSNKGVELTDAGKIVFDYADTILSLQGNIERDLKNLTESKKQLLVGSCKAVGEYALPCSIYTFKLSNQEIDINLEITNTKDVVENLMSKTVNIGLIHGNVKNTELKFQKIANDRLLLVTSQSGIKDNITIEEFTKLPLISREEGSGTRRTVLDALKKHSIKLDDLNIIYELNSMEAIKSSVIAGKGFSFIPELAIKKELANGTLRIIQVDELTVISEFNISYRLDHALSPHESAFIKFIKSSSRGFC